MRFAVSMLSVLGIASIIGTVLKQNESYDNYIIKFGQFWFNLFENLGLYDVYHSSWFLIILLFLVVSTSLPEAALILDFCEGTKRGIARPRRNTSGIETGGND